MVGVGDAISLFERLLALAEAVRLAAERVVVNQESADLLARLAWSISLALQSQIAQRGLVSRGPADDLYNALQAALALLDDMSDMKRYITKFVRGAQMEARFKQVFDHLSCCVQVMGLVLSVDMQEALHRRQARVEADLRRIMEAVEQLLIRAGTPAPQQDPGPSNAPVLDEASLQRLVELIRAELNVFGNQTRARSEVPAVSVVDRVQVRLAAEPPPFFLRPGTEYWLLNPHDVVARRKKIKSGGFGSVYHGTYRGEKVAIKFIPTEGTDSEFKRFKREVNIMNMISHKHVVQAIGAWYPREVQRGTGSDSEDEGIGTDPFIVMERVTPGDLGDALKDRRIQSVLEKLIVLRDVADALAHVHSLTIVHNDVKPSNVLVDQKGRAKLTDFGLSRMMKGSRASASRIAGSIPYLAPEVFKDGKITKDIDIWAFGVTCWEVFSGKNPSHVAGEGRPFEAQLIGAVMEGKRLLPVEHMGSDCPQEIRSLVLKCTQKDRKSRPAMQNVLEIVEEAIDRLGSGSASSSTSVVLSLTIPGLPKPSDRPLDALNAAEAGDVEAQFLVGLWYSTGSVLQQSDSEAARYFRLAAERGHAGAQNEVGRSYENGPVAGRDSTEAARWYRLAADQYHASAQFNLGRCHENGLGAETDEDEAVRLFRLAAGRGHAEALHKLGERYRDGYGVARDEGEALRFFGRAAEKGLAGAQYALGRHYESSAEPRSDSEAVQWCQKAANQGHALAQLKLGLCYEEGKGLEKDDREAVRLIRLAAARGHAEAQHNLGVRFRDGTGVDKDRKEAVKLFRGAAGQGFADAQYEVGRCYDLGTGVDADKAEGMRWYRLASDQGHAEAQYHLGVYLVGKSTKKDEEEAVELFGSSAEQGHADSQFILGEYHQKGKGVGKDAKEAARYFRLAADRGHTGAQNSLGLCFKNGNGVEKNDETAVRYFRSAAERGHAGAQNELGLCYEKGRGEGKDEAEAVRWYRKAAAQSYANAQFNLAVCYEVGRGVGQDDREAVRYVRTAADQGYAPAQHELARRYCDGRGVRQDLDEEVRLLRLAAEQGFANAQCELGYCFGTGRGVQKNEEEAVRWYRLAAAQGLARAQCDLGCCYRDGTGVEPDQAEAARLFRLAADQGGADGQCALGYCHEIGRGVERDVCAAVRWYRLAADQGHVKAQTNLGVLCL